MSERDEMMARHWELFMALMKQGNMSSLYAMSESAARVNEFQEHWARPQVTAKESA